MKNSRERVHEYTAFFEANEPGGYTVTVPALPALSLKGKNLEHARDMAKDAIRCLH
jgi:predicted RNase H-like HicB family nuclease